MKKAFFKTGLLACSFSFYLCAGLLAQKDSARLDLLDQGLFPPEFFPNLSEVSEEELLLAGLKSLYPKRILTEIPDAGTPNSNQPLVRPIGSNGLYIRVTHLPDALAMIEENLSHPLLVLDFRFLNANLESTLELGALITRQTHLRLALIGDYPIPAEYLNGSTVHIRGRNLRQANQTVFTLSNHKTQGPLEALLAQLKSDGEIISVGSPSAGQTASFRTFPGLDLYHLISGEIRPSDGASLLESGFIPQVEVAISREDDLLGYSSLREGISLDDLVQARVAKPRFDEARLLRERAGAGFPDEENEETDMIEQDIPQDTILQKALNIVKALQALGRIPH